MHVFPFPGHDALLVFYTQWLIYVFSWGFHEKISNVFQGTILNIKLTTEIVFEAWRLTLLYKNFKLCKYFFLIYYNQIHYKNIKVLNITSYFNAPCIS